MSDSFGMLEYDADHAPVGAVRYLNPLSTLLPNTLFGSEVHTAGDGEC